MAKILLGPMVGQISGSMGGSTFSHNRNGYYIRQRVKPVVVQTFNTGIQRNNFTTISKAWAALGANSKAAWENWAHNNPVTDRIGQSGILTGHQSFLRLGLTVLRNGGALPSGPPVAVAPTALLTVSLSADIGAGTVAIAFTPTPLGANQCIQVRAALMDGAGTSYVRNRYKLIYWGTDAVPSPLDIQSYVEARFGTMSVGQKLHVAVSVADVTTGLISGTRIASAMVVST